MKSLLEHYKKNKGSIKNRLRDKLIVYEDLIQNWPGVKNITEYRISNDPEKVIVRFEDVVITKYLERIAPPNLKMH